MPARGVVASPLAIVLLVLTATIRAEDQTTTISSTTSSTTSTTAQSVNLTERTSRQRSEDALARFVRLLSKPGAFKRVDAILGDNVIEESTACPPGEEGLECRRAEARRSVDCPRGDCYCQNCASAGPELWASCCRDSLRCCSHLAAACRNCDQPTLYEFCSKHFNKCWENRYADAYA